MFKLKKVTDLKENEVIHCPTEWEANEICGLMDMAGVIPKNEVGLTYDSTDWDVYEKDTCYSPFYGEYGDIEYYAATDLTIHPASDFIIKGKVIEVLDLEHGQKVKAWWESQGADVSEWNFNSTAKKNSIYRYYGIDKNGKFGAVCSDEIENENLQIIELPEEEGPKKRILTRKDFQRLYNAACEDWKGLLLLENEFAIRFALYDEQEVSEEFYKKMRKAFTSDQHKLLDEIFGKDEPKYKEGDWVYWELLANKAVIEIEQIEGVFFKSNNANWNLCCIKRLATPEEIAKATWKEGEPYLVRDNKYAGWQLRYSCKEYPKFYKSKKYSSNEYGEYWSYFQKLDINNLPEE